MFKKGQIIKNWTISEIMELLKQIEDKYEII